MEYHSVFTKNEIKFISKWLELETTILNEVTRSIKKKKNHMFSLICGCYLGIFRYVCFIYNTCKGLDLGDFCERGK